MGLEIKKERFSEADHQRFRARLTACLEAFEALLRRPGFGVGPVSVGAELEVSLVDASGRPLPLNHTVLQEALDPRLTVELDRFNLECNLRHTELRGQPFAHLERELREGLAVIHEAANHHGGDVVTIGILPTLRAADLDVHQMTDSRRFRVLNSALRRMRERPFHFHIDGLEPFEIDRDDLTFEGAATSLQTHLRVDPAQFVDTYNAAQLATGLALAASGNSPTFLGHRLWHETRIALFKQAVDDRTEEAELRHDAPRVDFGEGWLRGSVLDLYERAAAHEVVLPVCGDESLQEMRRAPAPRLEEMRLHQGTVWTWNRPVYDPACGGHLRIELRALPSGPTVADMLANIAFLLGLTAQLRATMETITAHMPFAECEHNFYRAAQQGLDAALYWPDGHGRTRLHPARNLLPSLVPRAREGLLALGVQAEDADPWLEVFAARCERGMTGAAWQLAALEAHEQAGATRHEALPRMLSDYRAHSATGAPVHTWPLPTPAKR